MMAIGNLEVMPDKSTHCKKPTSTQNYAQKWTVLQFLMDSCSPHYLDFEVKQT
jgi:hypothetical protein